MDLYRLPRSAMLGGEEYPHRSDFREILKLLQLLGDESRPEFFRWYTALAYFYEKPVPRALESAAMAYLSGFLTCGDPGKPGPKLLDWQQDAAAIMADVNAVAGRELRGEAYVHWWSFLGWFNGIREGQLSVLVGIRDKLHRGKKLEPQEQKFYRRNREKVRLRPRQTPEDLAQKQALEALLH